MCQEEIDEVDRAFARRWRLKLRLLDEGIDIDAELSRLFHPVGKPILELNVVDLGVELHADVSPDAKGLYRARRRRP